LRQFSLEIAEIITRSGRECLSRYVARPRSIRPNASPGFRTASSFAMPHN
jgi:hypothetical protein